MTVRTWFRLQRAAFWERDPRSASDIDTIANVCTSSSPLAGRWVRVGSIYWIESVTDYLERERVFKLVRDDMEQAMRRLMYAERITE